MRRRFGRFVVALAVLCALGGGLYMARAPILTAMGRELVHADRPVASDAILILSGGVFDRELAAADLYAQGLAPRVLMTRENEPPVFDTLRARGVRLESGLKLRRRVLAELGVPADRVEVLDTPVTSTRDEAVLARRWMADRRAGSLLVVTSSFHTARARYVFLEVFGGGPARILLVPAAASAYQPGTWWRHRGTLREGLFEWQKLVFYRLWY